MSYQRVRSQDQPQEATKRASECQAFGCPLPATFSDQMRGSNFMCRAHDGTSAHDWAAITERVKRIERAFFTAIDMTNASAGDKPEAHTVAKFIALSPEFDAHNMTARTYGAFALGKLLEKVRPKYIAPQVIVPNNEPLRRVDIQL